MPGQAHATIFKETVPGNPRGGVLGGASGNRCIYVETECHTILNTIKDSRPPFI